MTMMMSGPPRPLARKVWFRSSAAWSAGGVDPDAQAEVTRARAAFD